jgi:hypothetical protein
VEANSFQAKPASLDVFAGLIILESVAPVFLPGEETTAMSSDFIDLTAPPLQGNLPQDLPHGLITPPQQVRDLIEKERGKHPPEHFVRAESRLLNEWTLAYYFGHLAYEILYRLTPEGPEVLAVGFEEIMARTNRRDPEAMKGLQTWVP